MSESPLEEFQSLLSQFHINQEPTDRQELNAQLAQLSELLVVAEQVLLYLAMHKNMNEDFVTYLFEYKQLLKLEKHLHELRYTLPEKKPAIAAPVLIKPWWKFWIN